MCAREKEKNFSVKNFSHNYCDYHLLWAFHRATLCSNDRVAERVWALHKLLCRRVAVSSHVDIGRNRHGVRSVWSKRRIFKLIIIKSQARPFFLIYSRHKGVWRKGLHTKKKMRLEWKDKWQSYEMKFILILRLSLP
jgi:hypothetical protein